MIQQRLTNDIALACDIMRRDNNCSGVMDYVAHLSWLLFLKFLDRQEQAYASKAEIEGNKYKYLIEEEYRWSTWVPCTLYEKNLGIHTNKSLWSGDNLIRFIREDLLPYLSSLFGSPERDVIASIFRDHNVVVCASADNLKEVLKIVDNIDIEREDDVHTIIDAYQGILQKLGSENKVAGEFYTPQPIIQFMVKVVNPKIGETLYDPCCGWGGFLVRAYEHLKIQAQSDNSELALQQNPLFGQVKNAIPALFSVVNMLLHEAPVTTISRRNALEEDTARITSQFNIVLTNPPFGGTENAQIQQNFPVKSNATELLYLEHIMKKLKTSNGARCGMVVSPGVLFRDGAFATVKKELLNSFNLFMIVNIPAGAFAPYSGVTTSLLFFQRPGPTREILYHELTLPAKRFNKGNPITEAHFEEIMRIWPLWNGYLNAEAPRPKLPQAFWTETHEAIAKQGYNLAIKNPNRSADEGPPPSELIAVLLEHQRELQDLLQSLYESVTGEWESND